MCPWIKLSSSSIKLVSYSALMFLCTTSWIGLYSAMVGKVAIDLTKNAGRTDNKTPSWADIVNNIIGTKISELGRG